MKKIPTSTKEQWAEEYKSGASIGKIAKSHEVSTSTVSHFLKGKVERRLIRASTIDDFHARYTIVASGCWEWLRLSKEQRYGQFYYNGASVRAHRFSYLIHIGEIPDGLYVCHSCDNCKCVNPSHLFLGTNMDNVNDMISKGRGYWQKSTYKTSKCRF